MIAGLAGNNFEINHTFSNLVLTPKILDILSAVENYPHWEITSIKLFISGFLVFMFLYHSGYYLIFKTDKAVLVFSFLLLYLSVINLFLGEDLHGMIPWGIMPNSFYKLRYFAIGLSPLLFIIYLTTLFRNRKIHFSLLSITVIISLCVALLAIFTPQSIIYKIQDVFRVYIFISFSAVLFIVWKAYTRDEKGSFLILSGHIALYLALIGYLLYPQNYFYTAFIFMGGIFAFTGLQSYGLAIRYPVSTNNSGKAKGHCQTTSECKGEVPVSKSSADLMTENTILEEMNRRLQEQKEDMLTQSEMLDDLNQRIEMEMKKSDSLLLNILPKNIAHELKLHGKAPTNNFPNVSVLFIDFVGFSEIVEKVNARELVEQLHYYFANFDDVVSKYNLEKIKTIGDAYMCAGGLKPDANENDTCLVIYAALEILEFMNSYREERITLNEFNFDCRIGIHSGPVVAGVVGKSKFAFDIWGQTVNIAKEAEASSTPGRITISESTYQQVKDKFDCTPRGSVTLKHNRKKAMYFVEGVKIP